MSYAFDTEESVKKVSAVIKSDLQLSPLMLENLGPSFERMRMVEISNAIEQPDCGIIVLDKLFSPNQYSESIEMLKAFDENNLFIFARKRIDGERKPRLAEVLDDAKQFHLVEAIYENDDELVSQVRRSLR